MSELGKVPFTSMPAITGLVGMIFSPTLISSGGGSPVYNTANTWIDWDLIGNRVFLDCQITLTSLGTLAAGNLSIGTLPYPATSGGNPTYTSDFTVGAWANLAANSPIVGLQAGTTISSRSVITLSKVAASVNVSALVLPVTVGLLTVADISATLQISVTGTYQIY